MDTEHARVDSAGDMGNLARQLDQFTQRRSQSGGRPLPVGEVAAFVLPPADRMAEQRRTFAGTLFQASAGTTLDRHARVVFQMPEILIGWAKGMLELSDHPQAQTLPHCGQESIQQVRPLDGGWGQG